MHRNLKAVYVIYTPALWTDDRSLNAWIGTHFFGLQKLRRVVLISTNAIVLSMPSRITCPVWEVAVSICGCFASPAQI